MMALIFQFGRILLICFLAEILAALLPLPIPASVYGLLLMLAALGLKLIKVDQVKQASSFLVGILPIRFLVPAQIREGRGRQWLIFCKTALSGAFC